MARIITECQSLWIFSVCVPVCWVSRVRIYRCFLLPSSRWHLLNGGIISESVTSLVGVKWEDTLSTVWKFIIDFGMLCHWWRGDSLVLARWLIQSRANPEVILVHRWANIYRGLSVIFGIFLRLKVLNNNNNNQRKNYPLTSFIWLDKR